MVKPKKKQDASKAGGQAVRKKRLFLMLDALLAPKTDDDDLLFDLLRRIDALPKGVYTSGLIPNFRSYILSGEVYYRGRRGADMLPEKRFELTRDAVEDLELKVFLRRLCVDKDFLRHSEGLGLAQTMAIYENSEAVFRELCGDADPFISHCCARQLLGSAPTIDWFRERSPFFQTLILGELCTAFFFKGQVHPLLQPALDGRDMASLASLGVSADVLSMLAFWRGEPEEAMRLLHSQPTKKGSTSSSHALACTCFSIFCQYPDVMDLVGKTEAQLRKELRVRSATIHVGQILGLILNLGRFVRGEGRTLGVMRDDLETLVRYECQADERFSFGVPGFAGLSALDTLRCGNKDKAARALKDVPEALREDENFLSALVHYSARLRLKMGRHDDIALRQWYLRCTGFPWLQRCFADLLAATPGLADHEAWVRQEGDCPENFLDISKLVEDMPAWLLQLNALEHLAKSLDEEQFEKDKRIVWVVDMEGNRVEALEQTMGARSWSKGRSVSLKRLYEKTGDLSAMTARDKRIAACIETDTSWWQTYLYLRLTAACEELEGCDRVFERDGQGQLVPVRIRKGTLEFRLEEKGEKGYVLTFGDTEIPANMREDGLFFAREPGAIVYYKLNSRDQRIAALVGKGMEFPRESLSRILNLTRSNLNMALCTESIEAELVDAVTTPVLQLEQSPDGFEAVVGVRPFGRPDTMFFPTADGAREPLASVPLEEPADGEGAAPALQGEEKPARTIRVQRDFLDEQQALDRLVAACPSLAANFEDRHWRTGDLEEVLTLLEELRECGEPNVVEWPKGSRIRIGGKVDASRFRIRIDKVGNDWFGLSGDVQIDEERLVSLNAMLSQLEGSRFVSLGDGEYVALTADLRRKLANLKLVAVQDRKGNYEVNALASAAVEQALESMQVQADRPWKNSIARMHKAFATTPKVPKLLRADLREYQREGYEWMQRLAIWGVGACLADDMGLGKTLQSIAVLLNQAAKGPCLVVAPTSVCGNWELEIERFAPSLAVRRLGMGDRQATVDAMEAGEVLIVGYGLLPNVQEELSSRSWSMIVFDEAQALKNAATKRAKVACSLSADFRLALTGTPIENRIDDLWSLFNIINPGLLGSWESFTRRYGSAAPGSSASRSLRAVVKPFLLRRLKGAVLDELPEKTEQNLVVEPNELELAFYESLRRKAVEKITSSDASGGTRRLEILAELTKLRRACCHPGLADPDMLAMEKYSSKTQLFLDTVEDLVAGGHKVLAFSQFTTYLSQIAQALDEKKIEYQYLDGSTPEQERRRRVAAFQKGEGDVFLLSLKAGGTGINLTAADYVIHLDPWWNPAVEDQASDRAHRIGQKRPVTIYRMVQAGSVEEKILTLHASKRELAADFLEGTETSVKSLSEEELLALLR